MKALLLEFAKKMNALEASKKKILVQLENSQICLNEPMIYVSLL